MPDRKHRIRSELARIHQYAESQRFGVTSLTRAITQSSPSKGSLGRWATQKYWQVYLQNRVFSAIHCGTDVEDIRQYAMDQLIAEETDIRDGSDTHYGLMRRFANSMGVADETIFATRPAEPVTAFVDFLVCTAKRNIFEALACLSVNEANSAASSAAVYRYLSEEMDVDDHSLEWFIVHSQLDIGHSAGAAALIINHASETDVMNLYETVSEDVASWIDLQRFYAGIIHGYTSLVSDNREIAQ